MSWHKGTRKMICRTRMFALPHTFGPIKLLAYLVEALWFPGQTFSNGQFSCRIAPLCLLGLEVRTGRWSAVWAWIVVATLFQTCFRPAKINAWCWCIRVCSWVLPSEASQRAWRCRRHGGGMMCIYTYSDTWHKDGSTCPGKTICSCIYHPDCVWNGSKGNSDNWCETSKTATTCPGKPRVEKKM